MTEPATEIQFTGPSSVEDVMAALAKQSIFDLPTLVRELVKTTEERAGKEDDPVVWDVFISPNYVLQHVGSPMVTDDGSATTPR